MNYEQLLEQARNARERVATIRAGALQQRYPELRSVTVEPLSDSEIIHAALVRELHYQTQLYRQIEAEAKA